MMSVPKYSKPDPKQFGPIWKKSAVNATFTVEVPATGESGRKWLNCRESRRQGAVGSAELETRKSMYPIPSTALQSQLAWVMTQRWCSESNITRALPFPSRPATLKKSSREALSIRFPLRSRIWTALLTVWITWSGPTATQGSGGCQVVAPVGAQ
jgi:hypothetical protein